MRQIDRAAYARNWIVLASAAMLTACGGGGGTPVSPHPSPSSTPTATPTPYAGPRAQLVVTLQTSSGGPIAPATRFATFKIAGVTLGPAALTGCVTGAQGLTACKATVSAPIGQNESLDTATYASADTSGTPLAAREGTTVSVLANQTNYYTDTVINVATELKVSTQASPLRQGFWSSGEMTLSGVDAAGETVSAPLLSPSIRPFAIFLTATDSEGKTQIDSSIHSINGPFNESFTYSGAGAGPLTITAAASDFGGASAGVRPGAAALSIAAGASGAAQIFAGETTTTGATSTESVVEFGSSANGNAAPLRNLALFGSSAPYGADDQGNFWASLTRYSGIGHVLGAMSETLTVFGTAADRGQNWYDLVASGASGLGYCRASVPPLSVSIREFSAGSYGSPQPVRQISLAGPICNVGPLAVDSSGDVFVVETPDSTTGGPASISEFAASGSGALTPTRSISVSGSPSGTVTNVTTDGAGNLYAFVNGALSMYPPGSTTPQALLPGVNIASFAVDAGGDIFAEVPGANGFAIEEFPSGSSAPSRIITGSNTQLTAPGSITVAP